MSFIERIIHVLEGKTSSLHETLPVKTELKGELKGTSTIFSPIEPPGGKAVVWGGHPWP